MIMRTNGCPLWSSRRPKAELVIAAPSLCRLSSAALRRITSLCP